MKAIDRLNGLKNWAAESLDHDDATHMQHDLDAVIRVIEKLNRENAAAPMLLEACNNSLNALARHINEQRVDDDDAPVCIHVLEAYNELTAAIAAAKGV